MSSKLDFSFEAIKPKVSSICSFGGSKISSLIKSFGNGWRRCSSITEPIVIWLCAGVAFYAVIFKGFVFFLLFCAAIFLNRFGVRISQRPKSRAGDYWMGGRASLKDVLLSFLPHQEHMFLGVIFSLMGLAFAIASFDFSYLPHLSFNEPNQILYFVSLVALGLQLLAVLLLIMMCDLFFVAQQGVMALQIACCLGALWISFHNKTPQFNFSALLLTAFWFFAFGAKGRARMSFFKWGTSRNMRPKGFPPRREGRNRIVLIEPSWDGDFDVYTPRNYFYPAILPMVAATVPEDWDVMILDDVHNEIDFDLDVDVVGITAMTLHFPRSREIAREFRARGKTVIFGGPDASLMPEAYLTFGDCVLVGEAFGFLPRILQDWREGRLQKKYINKENHSLAGLPLPRNDLLPKRRYANFHNILVSTSCPFACEYCDYAKGKAARLRPVEELVAAIKHAGGQSYWFEAPELLIYKPYIKKLSEALHGMKIEWSTHASMKSCSDIENLKNARRAGLRQVSLGIESFSQEALIFSNKKMNKVSEYLSTLQLLDKAGISALVHLMFGFPQEKPEDFANGLEILTKGKVANVMGHRLLAYPGDGGFEMKLISAGAQPVETFDILNSGNTMNFKYYRPQKYSDIEYDLQVETFLKEFYSYRSIFLRIFPRSIKNFPNFLPDLFANLIAKHSGRDGMQLNSFSVFNRMDLLFKLKAGESRRVARKLAPRSFRPTTNFATREEIL